MRYKAFTLVELVIALVISLLVMSALFYSFNTVLKSQVQQSKIAETNIVSLLGLEILRKDIEMAGFGLPWSFSSISYSEAASDATYSPSPDVFNDASSGISRAFVLGDDVNTSANNSDVLIIKSSIVNYDSSVAQKYGLIYFDTSSSSWTFRRYSLDALTDGDYYILLDLSRNLISYSSTWYCSSLNSCSLFASLDTDQIYLYFGLSSSAPSMPFNRVDYYLRRPSSSFPDYCNPNSFELYRAIIRQADGTRDEQPVLDCVKDFQVSFGLDTNSDNLIDTWSSFLPADPSVLRNQVKQVRIFILIHEGEFDPNFTLSSTINLGDDDTGTLSSFTPSGDDVHYRWRVLKLVVNPLNILPQGR